MTENQNRADIVNTTDWFEAVKVFNGRRKLFSTIILICLFVLQLAFWANHCNWIEKGPDHCGKCVHDHAHHGCDQKCSKPDCDCDGKCHKSDNDCGGKCLKPSETSPADNTDIPSDSLDEPLGESTPPADIAQSAPTATVDTDEVVADSKEDAEVDIQKLQTELQQKAAQITGQPIGDIVDVDVAPDTEDLDIGIEEKEKSSGLSMPFPKPNRQIVAAVIKVCNFALLLFSVMYCLSLLMIIKISLCGSLGGLEHISRAFFSSLFLVIIIIPWQLYLDGCLVGIVYAPCELFKGVCSEKGPSEIAEILYYLRFCGLWLLGLITLCVANSRAGKWFRIAQKRLGIH